MNPSDFTDKPTDSVLQKSESETIARNIMLILERTGNEFRRLTWEEYKAERLKDGGFTNSGFTTNEHQFFKDVIDYCVSTDTAKTFSPVWNK